ncbi:hypothetical protein KJZ71_04860 [Patescibacteria group bacterium]|jgi:hypothetical protein|uniref:Uncharacterized protein n=1 Tax=candidate division WWE3 bacterium TaxID=2053526 RepID=A0A928Y690_UNCKA|nr:hypothetical protein [candidate division WWE3 bacterium]MCL4733098.1 hypothetical protein [Patescibacteria group bacterium]
MSLFELSPTELRLLRRLNRPWKIQEYLDGLPINFERRGETCMSPRRVMREKTAHCIEGAMFAALALRINGHAPLLVDIETVPSDDAHVMAVFRQNGRWGAIHKTNHLALRYRDPVYTSIRELVMSHFHEYADGDGRKTMRSFTRPIHLRRFDAQGWMTDEDDLWYIAEYIADVPHIPLLTRSHVSLLRPMSVFEAAMHRKTEWDRSGKRRRRIS